MHAIGRHWRERLATPVDIASLAVFRLLFGLVMASSVARFMAKGWVSRFLVAPEVHFTFGAFPFVRPWPSPFIELHYLVLFVAALGIAFGCAYRLCSLAFFLGFTYVELAEKSLYLNHYYLASLLAGLLCVLPAGRAFSIDAWRQPARALDAVPSWALAVLRVQVAVVYVGAGLAKLNRDWLVEGQPLRLWLGAHDSLPFVGPWLGTREVALAASWLAAAFDLGIVGLLLARRTRVLGACLLVGFHAVTGALFPIGIFPWLMTAAATVLLPPAWPRTAFAWLAAWWTPPAAQATVTWRPAGWLPALLVVHVSLQAVLPLRQHFARTPSAWTLEGFNFAWNVMLAEKAGAVSFRARDRRTGETVRVEPRTFLARFQEVAMAQDPDLVRQGALVVAERFRRQGRDVAVYADAVASLNGRPSRPLVNPDVDLTRALPACWIEPLE
jgi:vitamin K-dependent gamma-carboxylase